MSHTSPQTEYLAPCDSGSLSSLAVLMLVIDILFAFGFKFQSLHIEVIKFAKDSHSYYFLFTENFLNNRL